MAIDKRLIGIIKDHNRITFRLCLRSAMPTERTRCYNTWCPYTHSGNLADPKDTVGPPRPDGITTPTSSSGPPSLAELPGRHSGALLQEHEAQAPSVASHLSAVAPSEIDRAQTAAAASAASAAAAY